MLMIDKCQNFLDLNIYILSNNEYSDSRGKDRLSKPNRKLTESGWYTNKPLKAHFNATCSPP